MRDYVEEWRADLQKIYDNIVEISTLGVLLEGVPALYLLSALRHYRSAYSPDGSVMFLQDSNTKLYSLIRELTNPDTAADDSIDNTDDPHAKSELLRQRFEKRMADDDARRSSVVPFIFENEALNLRHFLIDEFQDTSTMQWESLKPLLDYGDPDDSLIIGDVKQSIYRFRQANSSLLHSQVENQYRTGGSPVQIAHRGDIPEENRNYRSSGVIVNFNNVLFGTIAAPGAVVYRSAGLPYTVEAYDKVRQSIKDSKKEAYGYVCLTDLNKIRQAETGNTLTEPEKVRLQTDRLIAEIRRERDAGFAFGDIAVLTSTNDQCSQCALALIEAHRALEDVCLEREVLRYKRHIEQDWAVNVYNGQWFSPLKHAMDAFISTTQQCVTGDVRIRLWHCALMVTGRQSEFSLYDYGLATYDAADTFDRDAAKGFIDLTGLSLRTWASNRRKQGKTDGLELNI